MKRFIWLVIICIPIVAMGQSDDSRRFSLGLFFSPGITYRQLQYSSSNQWIADEKDRKEISKFGYAGGAKIFWTYKKIRLQSGGLFVNRGERTKWEELVWASPGENYPVKSRTVFSYRSLEVPLLVRYPVIEKNRMQVLLTGGVSFNLFLNKATRVIREFSDGDRESDHSAKNAGSARFGLTGLLGVEAAYRLTDKVSMIVGPLFQHAITSSRVEYDAREYPYAVLMTFGFAKRFGKGE